MNRIRVVKLSGSPYDMGYAHGLRFRDEIRRFTEERVRLCQSPEWTGRSLSQAAVIALAEDCVAEHQAYANTSQAKASTPCFWIIARAVLGSAATLSSPCIDKTNRLIWHSNVAEDKL